MKISKILLFSIVIGGFFASCEKAYILPEPEVVVDPTIPVDSVKYGATIQPIFTNKCLGCHDVGDNSPDLSAANSFAALQSGYINTAAPSSSLLYTELNGGGMNNYANATEKASILKWIQQGAKNN